MRPLRWHNAIKRLIAEQRLSSTINARLTEQLASTTGARLSDVRTQRSGKQLAIIATVLTPRPLQPEDVATLEGALDRALARDVHLIVRSLTSVDVDREGAVFAAVEEPSPDPAGQRAFMATAMRVVSSRLAAVPGMEMVDLRRSRDGSGHNLTAVVRAPRPVTPDEVEAVERALRDQLGVPLRLTVETIPVTITTSGGSQRRVSDSPEQP